MDTCLHMRKNMFAIINYMHTEHRHTKGMSCLKQRKQVGSSAWRDISMIISFT